MKSGSSPDRRAICVTLSLPHSDAVGLQNLARSCAGQLRELGVLAVQVGSTSAISLQHTATDACRSPAHATGVRRSSLNEMQRNVVRHLGADPVAVSNVVRHGCAVNSGLLHMAAKRNEATSGLIIGNTRPDVAAVVSSPHIVNLLQTEALAASQPSCLLSNMPAPCPDNVRPKKRGRRRAASATSEVPVPSSMIRMPDCTSFAPFTDPSAAVTGLQYMPPETFKVPDTKKRRGGSCRKNAVTSSRQFVSGNQLTESGIVSQQVGAGVNAYSKQLDVSSVGYLPSQHTGGSLHPNGGSPGRQMPPAAAGWRSGSAVSMPFNGSYCIRLPGGQYGGPVERPVLQYTGVNHAADSLRASGLPDVDSYPTSSPPSVFSAHPTATGTFVEDDRLSVSVPERTLGWPTRTESQHPMMLYGHNLNNPSHYMRRVQNVPNSTQESMLRPFLPSPSGSAVDKNKMYFEGMNAMQMPATLGVNRLRGSTTSVNVSGVNCFVAQQNFNSRPNGLLNDVSRSMSTGCERSHHKVNGDVAFDILRHGSVRVSATSVDAAFCAKSVQSRMCMASPVTTVCTADYSVPAGLSSGRIQPRNASPYYVPNSCDAEINGCSAASFSTTVKEAMSADGDSAMQQSVASCHPTEDGTSV